MFKKLILAILVIVVAAQAQDTCTVDRCVAGTDSSADCQCNGACSDYDDCCSNYEEVCLSCQDRCGIDYIPQNECQCNDECSSHGNCCSDYSSLCDDGGSSGGGSVSNQDLIDFSEAIITVDLNNANSLIELDFQGSTSSCSSSDEAPNPMFSSVDDDSLWSIPTIGLLRELFDNYVPDVKVAEDNTSQEQDEQTAFLDAVMATPVMVQTYNFLKTKEVITGTIDDFQALLAEIWMEGYDRDGTSADVVGSSGFEHVFMGESKSGGISGFHNWIRFYDEETKGNADYKGYITTVDFGSYGSGVTNVMDWNGESKCIGGFFIGMSPELEMAVYSVCYLTRVGQSCNMSFNGVTFNIVTYDLDYNGKKYIGTAYPEFD